MLIWKKEVIGIKQDIKEVKKRLDVLEASVVTKDYLDEKLSSLRGELVLMINAHQSI